jgi:predicted TIM-barrel fold metal-dependent hydrolase
VAVFDLHCNWFQLRSAAALLAAAAPGMTVVVDHVGCLKLGAGVAEDSARLTEWRGGMAALAALPGTFVKLSGLEYVRAGWQRDVDARAAVAAVVAECVALFGPRRCMFASNFPVDAFVAGTGLAQLFADLHALVADLPLVDRRAMFHDAAVTAYCLYPL